VIIAYTALHYGSPYLAYAIRSVIDSVDKYVVLYSPTGSHGTQATMSLPPSEIEGNLYMIAKKAAGDKLEWHHGRWAHEGLQRDAIHDLYPLAQMVLVLDYDEIWPVGLAEKALREANFGNQRCFRMPMVHFWRSFSRAVLHDPAYPIRIIKPHFKYGEQTLHAGTIAHMGYAIPTWLLTYKMHIHGHRGELRKDNWLQTKWLANAQEDCHPVGSDFWNPETVEPSDYLPEFMSEHPYWGKMVIE
jgi:hypothetical protein